MALRKPAVVRGTRGLQTSRTFSLPAPVGGWNAKDPLAAMPPRDAIVLENWFPMASDIITRKGVESWATGFTSDPKAFLLWNGPSSGKLFAATSSGIFDVTAQVPIGAAVTTCTSSNYNFVNYTNISGTYLIAVNGVDKLKLYNGTTWQTIDDTTTPAITGLPTTSFSDVAVIKKRLWFIQKNSMSCWYLAAAAIGGALTEFSLGQVFSRGGHLVKMGNWTIDGGDGSDDYAVFVSSEGEIAIYKGIDPASSSTWSHVGTYYIGEPLGRNCLAKYGGDLLYLCQNGLFPLSKALQSAVIDRRSALTAKIDTAFTEAASQYGANEGWSVEVFPKGSFLLVNVPITASYMHQYVMNTITGAWCKFTGIIGNAWTVYDQNLFVCSDKRVGKAWTGQSDYLASIVCRAQQAYTYMKYPGRQKQIKLVRPLVTFDGKVKLQYGLDVDFAQSGFSSVAVSSPSLGYPWDGADTKWDAVTWGPSAETRRDWATISAKEFYAAALRLQLATTSITLRWAATDFVFEVGGVL